MIVESISFEEALEVVQLLLSKLADLEKRLARAEVRVAAAKARVAKLEVENASLRARIAKYEGKKMPLQDPSPLSGATPS